MIAVSQIGSWWLKSVSAEPGEHVIWSQGANRTQNIRRAVGGKLFLTDRRLIFCPHRFDAATGGKQWGAQLAAVSSVGIAPKTLEPWSGGARERLRVELTDGSVELFVVNHLQEVVARLGAACGD